MLGSSDGIALQQVVGFHVDIEQAIEQVYECLGIVVDPFEQYGLADHADTMIGQLATGRLRFGRQLRGVYEVQTEPNAMLPQNGAMYKNSSAEMSSLICRSTDILSNEISFMKK